MVTNYCEKISDEFSKVAQIDEKSFFYFKMLVFKQFGLSLNESNVNMSCFFVANCAIGLIYGLKIGIVKFPIDEVPQTRPIHS